MILSAVLAILIVNFAMQAISDATFATGILALATVALAGFTYWSIRNANDKEDRDRKERYFNEIIGWLTGLEGRLFSTVRSMNSRDAIEEVNLRINAGISEEQWQNIAQDTQTSTELGLLDTEIVKGEYAQKLADKLDTHLGELITNVLVYLKSRRQLDIEWLYSTLECSPCNETDLKIQDDLIRNESKPLDGVTNKFSLQVIKLGRLRNSVSKSVLEAINKAVDDKAALL